MVEQREHHYEYPRVVEIPTVREPFTADDFGVFPAMTKADYKEVPLAAIGAAGGTYKYYMKEHLGLVAWSVLGAGVLAYDALCPSGSTMSETVDHALEKHKLLTLGGIALVAGHLANIIPQSFDPIHKLVSLAR